MKTVWISALTRNEASDEVSKIRVAAVTSQLKRYGLSCQGHFWNDASDKTADKMSWQPALEAMTAAHAELWLILADEAEMAKPTVRYGLSLLAATVNAKMNRELPIVMLWSAKSPTVSTLPDLLQSALMIEEANPAWQAKMVAAINKPAKPISTDYRFNVLGDERLGQWFELGPRDVNWDGVLFGVTGRVAGAETIIDFQAIGLKNGLPEKSIVEFAQQGLKLQAGGRDFTAWALRNQVDTASSYYVRVKGCPAAILFSPYPENGEVDATIIRLI